MSSSESLGLHEPFNETQVAGVFAETPYLLEVEGVRKAFPGVVALDGRPACGFVLALSTH